MSTHQTFSSLRLRVCLGPMLLAVTLALSACGTSDTATNAAAVFEAKPTHSLSDGEILHVLRTLNAGVTAQAELALEKSRNSAVRDTAQRISRDHSQADERIGAISQAGIELEDNVVSMDLAAQLRRVRTQLADISEEKFDCAYLQKQIEQHRIALQSVRRELQPNAGDPAVRELLTNAESGLEGHIESAREAGESISECSTT